jgi:hypothetical protein
MEGCRAIDELINETIMYGEWCVRVTENKPLSKTSTKSRQHDFTSVLVTFKKVRAL